MTPRIQEAVGVEDFLIWILEDTREPAGSPGSAVRLRLIYKTGNLRDTWPAHHAEVCLPGGGRPAVNVTETSLPLRNDSPPTRGDDVVPLRVFQYREGTQGETVSMGYFWIANGKYFSAPLKVRFYSMLFGRPTFYFCLVEMVPGRLTAAVATEDVVFEPSPMGEEELKREIGGLLKHLLPELEQCLPAARNEQHPVSGQGLSEAGTGSIPCRDRG